LGKKYRYKPWKKRNKVAVSGYFLWLHIGHIEYFRQASKLGRVIAIVNNDTQQILKYGKIIVPLEERLKVIQSIRYVDKAIPSIDKDRTVCKTLEMLKPDIFANGGDRDNKNVPEKDICDKCLIKMVYGLGDKVQSTSWLFKKI